MNSGMIFAAHWLNLIASTTHLKQILCTSIVSVHLFWILMLLLLQNRYVIANLHHDLMVNTRIFALKEERLRRSGRRPDPPQTESLMSVLEH